MKATLIENRVGQHSSSDRGHIVKAGTVVTVIGYDEENQRFIGKAGIWTLNFTPDQATPIED